MQTSRQTFETYFKQIIINIYTINMYFRFNESHELSGWHLYMTELHWWLNCSSNPAGEGLPGIRPSRSMVKSMQCFSSDCCPPTTHPPHPSALGILWQRRVRHPGGRGGQHLLHHRTRKGKVSHRIQHKHESVYDLENVQAVTATPSFLILDRPCLYTLLNI